MLAFDLFPVVRTPKTEIYLCYAVFLGISGCHGFLTFSSGITYVYVRY